MPRPRIIPCLLLRDGALVKTTKFDAPKYVGDPLNAVRIFNEKNVDELIIADIGAARGDNVPNLELIGTLAAESRMPLCYAGGVSSADLAERIVALGVEKVGIGTAGILRPSLLADLAERLGRQSVVALLDIVHTPDGRRLAIHGGTQITAIEPSRHMACVIASGAGEILVNSVDRDGTGSGYDIELLRHLSATASVPVIGLGGAGKLSDIRQLLRETRASAAAAGSLFVFKGRHRAVLLSYPDRASRDELFISDPPTLPHIS